MNHRPGTLALILAATFLAASLTSCRTARTFTIRPTTSDVVELPLTVRDADAIVTVTLNGREVPLQLDLGGFSTVSLSSAVLETIAPRFTGGSERFNDALGNTMTAREYLVDAVTIGAQRLDSVYGSEFLTMQRTTPPCDNGYLGHGILKRFNLLFDYPAGKLYLLKGAALPPGYDLKGWTVDTFEGESVVTRHMVGGKRRTFLWDTGAGYSIVKPGEGIDVRPGVMRRGHDAIVAQPFPFGAGAVDSLAFVVLGLTYPEQDGLIGHNYFAEHPVYINWDTHTIATR